MVKSQKNSTTVHDCRDSFSAGLLGLNVRPTFLLWLFKQIVARMPNNNEAFQTIKLCGFC